MPSTGFRSISLWGSITSRWSKTALTLQGLSNNLTAQAKGYVPAGSSGFDLVGFYPTESTAPNWRTNTGFWAKIFGEKPPLATGFVSIQYAIEHISQRSLRQPTSSSTYVKSDLGSNIFPKLIGYISWVVLYFDLFQREVAQALDHDCPKDLILRIQRHAYKSLLLLLSIRMTVCIKNDLPSPFSLCKKT